MIISCQFVTDSVSNSSLFKKGKLSTLTLVLLMNIGRREASRTVVMSAF